MKNFRDLKVWEKAHELALMMYRLTASFPKEELYGLTSQIRRAGAAIPANIAEGCGRNGDLELARFLQIAAGSASELEYHLLLAKDLGMVDVESHTKILDKLTELRHMLTALIGRVRNTPQGTPTQRKGARNALANRQKLTANG